MLVTVCFSALAADNPYTSGEALKVRHEIIEHHSYEESIKHVKESGHRWTLIAPAQAAVNRLKESLGESKAYDYLAQKAKNPHIQKVVTIVIASGSMSFGWWIANPTNPGNTVLVAGIFATAINLAYTVGQKQVENYMKNSGKIIREWASKAGFQPHNNVNSRRRAEAVSRMASMIPFEFIQTSMFQYAFLLGGAATAAMADPTFVKTTTQLIAEAITSMDVLYRTMISAFGVGAVNVYLISKKPHWGESRFLFLWLSRIATFSMLGAFMVNGHTWAKLTVTGFGVLAFASMMKPQDKTILQWMKEVIMGNLEKGEILLTKPKLYPALSCLRAG